MPSTLPRKSNSHSGDAAAVVNKKMNKKHQQLKYKKNPSKANEDEEEIEIVPIQEEEYDEQDAFHTPTNGDDDEHENHDESSKRISSLVKTMNRKGKKSGGFQSMGLSYPVFKAIGHLGYKIPTPIQRKSIPLILHGRDVVAMARTGSGKTAAFVIPLIERLKSHSAKVGARALILSPSRELAFQTGTVVKSLGKHTDLRHVSLVGGDQLEDQFTALAGNPDILVATPGRLMHLIVEMKLDLSLVEYVVFDEADRLFEMGFAEQLQEILTHLPRQRQTLLFSATLPKLLVDFAKAGLENPALVRLDVDTKISQDLQMYFFSVKAEEKEAALLYLLRTKISSNDQCVLFVSTKHHVEYIHNLLQLHNYSSTYIYGALDQLARQHHLSLFRNNKAKILVVTDVAARGIDIPLLDHVINYDFPGSSKVFVHRVGRTARAGRAGSAWSFIAQDELPYMLDLQLFTGRPLVFASVFQEPQQQQDSTTDSNSSIRNPNYTSELVYGHLPPSHLAIEMESTASSIQGNITLESLKQSCLNSYKMVVKSRPQATSSSYKRAKEISAQIQDIGIHPLFLEDVDSTELKRVALVRSLAAFRPAETIFEIGKMKSKLTSSGSGGTAMAVSTNGVMGISGKSAEALVMMKRRSKFQDVIAKAKESLRQREREEWDRQVKTVSRKHTLEEASATDLADMTSSKPSASKKMKRDHSHEKSYYLSYTQPDADTEKGYSVHGNETSQSFSAYANQASLNLMMDDSEGLLKQKSQAMKWDSKQRKFVKETVGKDNKKMIRTESGALISASWNSSRFRDWQKRTNMSLPKTGEQELADSATLASSSSRTRTYRHNSITAPTKDSKSFTRKQNQVEAMLRKKGYKGDQLKDMAKTMLQEPVSASAKANQKGRKGGRSGAGKSELKNVEQIAKERKVKEQRRAKTGRHRRPVGSKRK